MLIRFNILWFEDVDVWFNSRKRELERVLDNLGFKLEVTRISEPSLSNVQ